MGRWDAHTADPMPDRDAKPLQLDLATLTAALRAIEDIEYAWLFGSRATGKERPDSDVDLAIGLAGGDDLELLSDRHDRILAALDPIVPNERMDLIVLTRHTPAALRHQIFKHGKLLFARTLDHLVPLRVQTAREWGDGQARRAEAWVLRKRRMEERAWSTKR